MKLSIMSVSLSKKKHGRVFRANIKDAFSKGFDVDVWGLDFDDQKALEASRRIVACVNACEGIPTEELEAGNAGLLEVLKKYFYLKEWQSGKIGYPENKPGGREWSAWEDLAKSVIAGHEK